jgi:hypothetical protein
MTQREDEKIKLLKSRLFDEITDVWCFSLDMDADCKRSRIKVAPSELRWLQMPCTPEDRSRKNSMKPKVQLDRARTSLRKIAEKMCGIYGPDQTRIGLQQEGLMASEKESALEPHHEGEG